MIHLVTRADYDHTVRGFLDNTRRELRCVRLLSYEGLWRRLRAPVGHYIFTDFDRLTGVEIDVLISLTDTLRQCHAGVRILNDPRWVLERVPLLRRLEREGLNRFGVTRLDAGERPSDFPVFIRSEDGCAGPETGLIDDEASLDASLHELRARGLTLKRRIAVGFCAEPDAAGYFRKYGAMNVAGVIIPQHIHRALDWNVKWRAAHFDASMVAEELTYLCENPHRDQLREIFHLAHIDYGRIDYGIVDGKVQTFEINTNPSLPRFANRNSLRAGRHDVLRPAMIEALRALDSPVSGSGTVAIELPEEQRPGSPASASSALHRRLRRIYRRLF